MIANYLKEYFKNKKISQYEIENKTGINQSKINLSLNGKRKITAEELLEISNKFNINLEKLKKDIKKNKRQQEIIGLIKKIPDITVEYLSEKLDVNEKTIRRDISELKENGVLERIGGSRFGGEWAIIN